MTINVFTGFKDMFLADLRSTQFGAYQHDAPKKGDHPSPAARQLRRGQTSTVLESNRFLESVYRIVQEHQRLLKEQDRIPGLARELRPRVKKLEDALKTLQTVTTTIHNLEDRLKAIARGGFWDDVYRTLKICGYELNERKNDLIFRLPQAQRLPHHKPSGLAPILKGYDYDLPTLRKKAPDHWLWERVDTEIITSLRNARAGSLPAITRYHIIAAIMVAAGVRPVEANTIKQYFQSKKPR